MQYGLAQVIRSGNGPFIDMKIAKKAEVFAWGGYKGRLHTALIDAVGTTTINGVEVYNEVPLMGKIENKQSPESKILELLGMEDEDRKKIIDGYQSDIKSVTLNWNSKPKASGNRLEQELRMIRKALDGYDKIVVTQDWRQVSTANKNTLNFGYTWQQGVKSDTMDYSLNHSYYTPKPPKPNPDNFIWDKTQLIDKYMIHLVRPDGTMDVPDLQMKEALTALILLSRSVAFTRLHNEHHFRDEGNGHFIILTKEDYDAKLDITAVAQNIDMYAKKVGAEYVITETDYVGGVDAIENPIPRYGYHVWLSDQIDHTVAPPHWYMPVQEQGIKDVFKATNGLFIEENGIRYLIVKGLKQCQPSQFVWVSSFANIEFKPKKGGFLKRFFGGLMKGIMSFINTFVEVVFKVPILGFMFGMIAGILIVATSAIGGNVEVIAKSIFKAILTASLLYYAPAAFGFEAGAIGGASIAGVELGSISGLGSMISIGSSAMGNYSQYQWENEQSEYDWENEQDTDTFAAIKEVDIAGHNDPSMWEKMYYVQYTGMFDTEFIFTYQNTDRIPEYGRPQV